MTSANFGLLIAYMIPGFILLWGLEPYSPTLAAWLGNSHADAATLGGFLYGSIASVGLGVLSSTVRWLIIDRIHELRGIHRPLWDFRKLQRNLPSFERLIEDHFRYYQFHANSIVAVTLSVMFRTEAFGFTWIGFVSLIALNTVLYLGSVDTITKYYQRVTDLLASAPEPLSGEEFSDLDV